MHTGETYEISVESYDMAQINEQRNNNELTGILIGDYSLSRINIRDIIPIHEEPEGQPEQPEEEPIEEPIEEPNEQNKDLEN